MISPTVNTLYAVVEATWPSAAIARAGPWAIRNGGQGGKRVSAATAEDKFSIDDLPLAASEMEKLGQRPLFMIRDGEEALDEMLAQCGYEIIDPVTLYLCPIDGLLQNPLDRLGGFAAWPPMAAQEEIWQAGGIGPGRWAVMRRCNRPKTTILGRARDTPAGAAYVAIHKDVAMVHALEVAPSQRRQGAARNMMIRAAEWAKENGANWMSLVTTSENLPSNTLYLSLNMLVVGYYHYRIEPDSGRTK